MPEPMNQVDPANRSSRASRSVARPRILVVDDEQAVRDLVAKTLAMADYDVETVADGPTADGWVAAAVDRGIDVDAESWFTATVRPAGPLGHRQADRLAEVLLALAASASVVVLDLQAARLSGRAAAAVVDDAADRIERRGGCLLCVNADADSRATMAGCRHAVVLDAPPA